MSKFRYIMWDWNGTLLDDLKANFDTINKLLSDRNLPEMKSIEEYRSLFCFPVIGFYEKTGFDLEMKDSRILHEIMSANTTVAFLSVNFSAKAKKFSDISLQAEENSLLFLQQSRSHF